MSTPKADSSVEYRVNRKRYRNVLGTLHPSCQFPEHGLAAGNMFQIYELSSRGQDTGNILNATVVRVERKARANLCRVFFAVNTLARAAT